MNALIAQAEAIGHVEFPVREHRRAQSMLVMSLLEFARGVGAHRQDRNTALVEFGSEFFPSP